MNPMKRVAPIMGLVAMVALVACGTDSRGPADVDPALVEQGLDEMTAQFTGNAVFQSMAALSGRFTLTAAGSAALRATLPFAPDEATNLAKATLRRSELVRAFASLAPNNPAFVIPVDVRGRTYVWDPAQDRYVQSQQAGAPANGLRFLLYVVDPVTGLPQETPSLQLLGHVDLTDKSTNSADILGVQVQFGSQTVADYDITAQPTTTSLTLGASGSLFGSAEQVDFSLQHTLTSSSLNVDYHVEATNGWSIDATLQVAFTQTGATLSVDFTVSGGGNSLQLVGTVTSTNTGDTVNLQIKYNGTTVATIAGDADNPTVAGVGGQQLGTQEVAHLVAIFEAAGEIIEQLGHVFGPAEWLFGV